MKVFLDTIGCRLNQAEIEQYARQFRQAGHEVVASPAEAEVVVINTCAVTAEAASDSRQKIRQAARAWKSLGDFSSKQIVLTGCWSSLEPEAALEFPGVTRVVSNLDKDTLVAQVLGQPLEFELEPLARRPLPGSHQRTRAFIKVQDGCDNFCTFCVTRIARGASRSRPAGEVLADIRAALAGGTLEVVLTGVQLGSWGRDFTPSLHLKDLIQLILTETDAPRVRLSSLEPWDLDESFFALWQNPRLCAHLHMPLQSGAAGTLRRMGRKTSPAEYAHLVHLARQAAPEMALTTDLLVGFPGETEAEFIEGLEFVRQTAFAAGHVFPFSPRPGTPALRLPNPVPPPVAKQRARQMRALLAEASQAYHQRFIGSEAAVLWETARALPDGNWALEGLTGNYLRVISVSAENIWNQISRVRLLRLEDEKVHAQIL